MCMWFINVAQPPELVIKEKKIISYEVESVNLKVKTADQILN